MFINFDSLENRVRFSRLLALIRFQSASLFGFGIVFLFLVIDQLDETGQAVFGYVATDRFEELRKVMHIMSEKRKKCQNVVLEQ